MLGPFQKGLFTHIGSRATDRGIFFVRDGRGINTQIQKNQSLYKVSFSYLYEGVVMSLSERLEDLDSVETDKAGIRCQSLIVGNYRQTVLAICLLAGNQGLTISKGDISNVYANVGQGNEESTSSSMCTSPLSSHLTLGILRGIHKYSTPDAYAIAHDKCIIICQ